MPAPHPCATRNPSRFTHRETNADPQRLIRDLRRMLRPRPLACPHCACDAIHRWGHFSGRQRFRCTACGRTFSDFTGTAVYYLKRLDRWAAFCRRLPRAESVRRSAAWVGVHRDTVFHWRHLVLGHLRDTEICLLHDAVDIAWTCLPFSEKGRRDLDRRPRRRKAFWWFVQARAWVLLACDGHGRGYARHAGLMRRTMDGRKAGERPPSPARMADLLSGCLDPLATLSSRMLAPRVVAATARAAGLPWRAARGVPSCAAGCGGSDARNYGCRLRAWLRRFRGVATRYLDQYLAWFRFCRRPAPSGSRAGRLSPPGRPRMLTNTIISSAPR